MGAGVKGRSEFGPGRSVEFTVLFLLCLVFPYGMGRQYEEYVLSKKCFEPDGAGTI